MIEIGTRVRILIELSAGLSTIGTVEAHDNSNLLEWNHLVRPENSDRTIALEESEIEIVEDEEHRGYEDQEDAYDRSADYGGDHLPKNPFDSIPFVGLL